MDEVMNGWMNGCMDESHCISAGFKVSKTKYIQTNVTARTYVHVCMYVCMQIGTYYTFVCMCVCM